MADYNFIFKYILVGDSGVGKSSILLRFTSNQYSHLHDMTIGVEFGAKIINVHGYKTKLQIWDTAGQEAFRSITRSYYRNSAGVILVYDITRRDTFNHLVHWLQEVRNNGQNHRATILLVGNKSDAENRRVVTLEEGEKFATDNGLLFAECSVKNNNEDVNLIFSRVAEHIYETIDITKKGNYEGYGIKANDSQSSGGAGGRSIVTVGKQSDIRSKCC